MNENEKRVNDLVWAEMNQMKIPPGVKVELPPQAAIFMRGVFIAYESRKSLTVRFPVFRETLNPIGVMQGGFIAVAFDNTFGPLSYLAARATCVTIDMNQQYIRGIREGQLMTIKADVIARGRSTIAMRAEAHDEGGKLIANAQTNLLIMGKP